MKYTSTRKQARALLFSEAILKGLADDGGLYVPEAWPQPHERDFKKWAELSWNDLGVELLRLFLKGDPLEAQLPEICNAAFNFPVPLKKLSKDTYLLELFHGPTCAFKDVGARFLAECVSRLRLTRPQAVIVATSGDTGGAVAAAFYKKSRVEVTILYPQGRISPRQEKQLTAWGNNVKAIAVDSDFDECQRRVKEMLADPQLSAAKVLLSANSISLGRLLPQMVYYAYASLQFKKETGKAAGFIIPSGNLGNAVAAYWAHRLGFPIREIVLATNANTTIPDFLKSGKYEAHPTIATLANAMDVGNPSNMERLRDLYPEVNDLKKITRAFSVNDSEIRLTIQNGVKTWKEIFCPHTATAVHVREQLGKEKNWVIVATAHPAKFESIVEPLVNATIPIPSSLADILKK